MKKETKAITNQDQEKKPLTRAEKAGFCSIAIAIVALGLNSVLGFIIFSGLAGFYLRNSQYFKRIRNCNDGDGSLSKNDPLDPCNSTGFHMRETRSNNYK